MKKTLLVAAIGALAAVNGKLTLNAPAVAPENPANTLDEQELLSDCPGCIPRPSCYPGDNCDGCG